MSRPVSITVPAFRSKMDVVRGILNLRKDTGFAELMGVTPERLSSYLNKDGVEGWIPRSVVDRMARTLSQKLGFLSEAEAKAAWLGSFANFFLTLAAGMKSAFATLIQSTTATLDLDVMLLRDALSAVDDDVEVVEGEVLPAEARFQIVVGKGETNAYLVALVQSVQGWHFVAPRTAQPQQFGAGGILRAPPGSLRFLKDGGWHVIYAFAVACEHPPRVLARPEFRSPLSSGELDQFAVELTNPATEFALGKREVFVRPAD